MRRLALVVSVLGACGVIAPAASASTAGVSVGQFYDTPEADPYYEASLAYTADPGEANDVRVSQASGVVSLADLGATIRAGQGCTSVDAHHVTCQSPQSDAPLVSGSFDLGDLGDHMTLDASVAFYPVVDGGGGDDVLDASAGPTSVLRGGEGDDHLTGGPGRDDLTGGAGSDTLEGGGGDDTLRGGDHGAAADASDVIDGGPGIDEADYSGRSGDVIVDLEAPDDAGAPGEHDHLRSIENVTGGDGRNVLAGDDGPNWLVGSHGNRSTGDVLAGRGGDDHLNSGRAARLDGGAGDDTLFGAGEGYATCGPGSDRTSASSLRERIRPLIASDCERVYLAFGGPFLSPIRLGGTRAALTASNYGPAFCGSVLSLRAPSKGGARGALYGRTHWRWHHRRDVGVSVTLTSLGRRAVAHHHTIEVRVTDYNRCFSSRYAPSSTGFRVHA
jgi:Ca2+-binding RTX toxin-like protein